MVNSFGESLTSMEVAAFFFFFSGPALETPFKLPSPGLPSQEPYSPIGFSPGASELRIELQTRCCRICTEKLTVHPVKFSVFQMDILPSLALIYMVLAVTLTFVFHRAQFS